MNNRANKIKEQRKTLTYSTKELASLVNVPEKNIIDYEANKKIATLRTINKIAIATNTKVSDWVDEDYFEKSRYIENISNKNDMENISDKNDNELLLCLFRAMFRADDVMETLYSALIEMKEIEMTKDEETIFSGFSKEMLESIASIKLKKIINVCKPNKNKGTATKNTIVERSNSYIETKKTSLEKITFNGLLQELRVLFKNTDVIEVMIEALINIRYIDTNGCRSEKADLLLTTIISEKVKSLIIKKADVESFK